MHNTHNQNKSRNIRSPKDLGHALEQNRLSKGMTQATLAKSIQKHQTNISRLETGDHNNTISMLFKILSILDLEVEIRPRQKSSAQDIEDMFT